MDYLAKSTVVSDEEAARIASEGVPESGAVGLPPQHWQSATSPVEWEHNTTLAAPKERAILYAKMHRTSASVRLAYEGFITAFHSTQTTVVKSDTTDPRAVELLDELFGFGEFKNAPKCETTIPALVERMGMAVMTGAAFSAPEWYEDDGSWWVRAFHTRHLETITHIFTVAAGQMIGFRQRVNGKTADVWNRQIVWNVYRESLGGHLGMGLQRPMVGTWQDEQAALTQLRVALRRYAMPNPIITVGDDPAAKQYFAQNASPDEKGKKWEKEVADNALKTFSKYASGLSTSFWMPWFLKADFFDSKFDPEKLNSVIRARGRDILAGVALQWINQGQSGEGGARSMIQTQSAFFRELARQALGGVYEAINRFLITQFFKFNLPDVPSNLLPTITFTGLEPVADDSRLQRTVTAHSVGIFTASSDDEAAFREGEGYAPMTDEAAARTVFDRAGVQASRTESGQRQVRQTAAEIRAQRNNS